MKTRLIIAKINEFFTKQCVKFVASSYKPGATSVEELERRLGKPVRHNLSFKKPIIPWYRILWFKVCSKIEFWLRKH